MKWEKRTRFKQSFWFSGIYKISSYTFHPRFNNQPTDRYYQVYKLCPSGQWGDYVNSALQRDKMPTLAECKAIAAAHAKEHQPDSRELAKAERAKTNWLNV